MRSEWAQSWPRSYKQVFALINGQRDAQRLAGLLHKPQEVVEQILDDLLVSGFISLRSPAKELVMNAPLLKESFDLISSRKDEFSASFFERLFKQYPMSKRLFADAPVYVQAAQLAKALEIIVTGVTEGQYITPALQSLGERFKLYHVHTEHYAIIGRVLAETFQMYLKARWTPAFRSAWLPVCEIVARVMLG